MTEMIHFDKHWLDAVVKRARQEENEAGFPLVAGKPRALPPGAWALRVFMFFSPKQGVLDHIADSQIYWPKNNVQPLVMFTTVGETRRDNIEWGNSATRERAANRPATWGVFSQAPNRKLAAEFVEWFERRLGAGQSSGQRRRRA